MFEMEKPQKGNPHGLTIYQHIFPVMSISRFTSASGVVELKDRVRNIVRFARPTDRIFCARRVWDEMAEQGWMKKIEDSFQAVADRIIQGQRSLTRNDNRAITSFYALWDVREHQSRRPFKDQYIGIPERHQTKTDLEYLEKHGVFTIPNSGYMAGRHFANSHMFFNHDNICRKMKKAVWGIVRCDEAEFIVPDNFSSVNVVPLQPRCCFIEGAIDQYVGAETARHLNSIAYSDANTFIFAKCLSEVPGLE